MPKPGGKPHTSYMFKHSKFPRGHTFLSQGPEGGVGLGNLGEWCFLALGRRCCVCVYIQMLLNIYI